MKNFNVKIDEALHKRFKIACVLEGTEMSEVIRRHIENFAKRAEKKQKSRK
jgi:hypothetical protein